MLYEGLRQKSGIVRAPLLMCLKKSLNLIGCYKNLSCSYANFHGHFMNLTSRIQLIICLNPIVFKKAKTAYNFGLSECNRVKLYGY